MPDQPIVSIITATYNSEKTIAETIESILNQTYKNIEYLIIDGESIDKTVSIIKAYEPLFGGRLKWISEKDKGIYDAWNKGLKMSTGDWISFVGSDDILLNNSIEKYVDEINKFHDLNFISSKCLLVKENLNPIRIYGKPWTKKMHTYNCIAHVGSLHHKSLFEQKGLFNTDYLIVGDYDFLLRCLDIIKPYYLPIVTANVREGGISGRSILIVGKEVLRTKINNKSKNKINCYVDNYKMILKFYLRTKLINYITKFNFQSKKK